MSKSGLGRAIINKIQKKKYAIVANKAPIFIQQSQENQEQKKKAKLKSVIQQNSLNQFLQVAQISGKNFQANRNIKFKQIRQQMKQKKIVIGKQVHRPEQVDQSLIRKLQLPRRPIWKNQMSKQQLQKKQNQAYIKWRQQLSKVEQTNDIHITPYQKNIQVWRQLWRVVERSDLLIQIVDGRDPLFFWSQDLFDYVRDLSKQKQCLLLINKSDLVQDEVIQRWSQYLKQININHIFFSAKPKIPIDDNLSQMGSEITKQQSIKQELNSLKTKFLNKPKVLLPQQLIKLLTQLSSNKEKIQVGMVGYPNVGKSSIINTILGKKKVGVANMPGKTKHFQTLILNSKVTLCDCPGLVFPKVSASVGHMVLNGLYPIDTIKKYQEPIKLLLQRVPKEKIIKEYGLHWKQDDAYSVQTILSKYSQLKGFFTGSGLPNQAIAARHFLKDYVSGNLVYAKNPPNYVQQSLANVQESVQNQLFKKKSPQQIEKQNQEINKIKIQKQIDKDFFEEQQKGQTLDDKHEQVIQMLDENDLLDLIEGKKVGGLKVTKQTRKSLKHALKRGQKVEDIKQKYLLNMKTEVFEKKINKK